MRSYYLYVVTLVTGGDGERVEVATTIYHRADVAWENFLEHVVDNQEGMGPDDGPEEYLSSIAPGKAVQLWQDSKMDGPDRAVEWLQDSDGNWELLKLEKVQVGK